MISRTIALSIFIFLFCFLTVAQALAKEERVVEMQWPAIQGAVAYDFELFQKYKGKFISQGSEKKEIPNWSKKLSPGVYKFRIRSIDYRDVPGEWSKKKLFLVKLPAPVVIKPLDRETMVARGEDSEEVRFQWQNVLGAELYYLKVQEENGKKIFSGRTSQNSKMIMLSVAKKYSWKVWSLASSKDQLDPNVEAQTFTLLGGVLDPPQLDMETDKNYFYLKWSSPSYADSFYYSIFKKRKSGWKIIKSKENYPRSSIRFRKKKIRPGHYRFSVQALGKARGSSNKTIMDFLWNGNSAEKLNYKEGKRANSTEDFEGEKDWIVHAMLDFPEYTYNGQTRETNTAVSNTLSGQSLSIDLVRKYSDSNWRLSSMFNYDAYVTVGSKWNLFGFHESLRYSKKISSMEYGFNFGLFIKQFPYIYADKSIGKTTQESISILGESLALTAGWQLSKHFKLLGDVGLQLHTLGLSTPAGSLSMTTSKELNLWLAYIYKNIIQFKLGLGIADYNNSFKPTPTNLTKADSENSATLTGSKIRLAFGISF